MANSIVVVPLMTANFIIDSNASASTGTPLTVLCNRQYRVTDFAVLVSALAAEGDGSILIESITGGTVTPIGSVAAGSALVANLWRRPSTTAFNLGTDSTLIAASIVARGSTLRVRAQAAAGADGAAVRGQGVLKLFPDNRYGAATTTSDYPNNSANGTNLPGSSNATTAI